MSALELYEDLVAAGKLERDRAQERLLARFAALEQRVAAHRSARGAEPLLAVRRPRTATNRSKVSTSTATSAAARPC